MRPPIRVIDRPSAVTRQAVSIVLVVVAGLVPCFLTSCSGPGVRSKVSVGPRLSSARLGSFRCAMTCEGDWLGGMPPAAELGSDLELAARRGVDLVIDLRSPRAQSSQPLAAAVEGVGLTLLTIEGTSADHISADAIDEVRQVLNAPGRRRLLLIDEDGTRASMIYAIHLAADEGIAEADALRAARAIGLGQLSADFVHGEVERIRSGA